MAPLGRCSVWHRRVKASLAATLATVSDAAAAPRVFAWTNRHGNPYMAVVATSALSLLAYLSVSAGTAKVLG
jgi:amino acid permease